MKKLILFLFCVVLVLSGCSNTQIQNSVNNVEDETEEIVYTSKIKKSECALCSKGGKTLLPAYAGQNNVGIICINTFDISPVSINRYDDFGNLIEEAAGHMTMNHNSFGEGRMSTSTSTFPDRGYADVDVNFSDDKTVNKKAIEKLLCQDCLTTIMEDVWKEPYGVGIINFETLEARLFEESITAFTFGDYYIDIDLRENKEDPERIELDLLIFYCPPRYE